MARTSIIKPIIETRVDQVADFATPQDNKYATGFVIQPKRKSHYSDKKAKITKQQQLRCDEITEWLINCGANSNEWHGETFDSFIRKTTRDSLTYDQDIFELIENRGGKLVEVVVPDGSSFRFTDWINDTDYEKTNNSNPIRGTAKLVKGYPPYYCQIYQARIIAEFYPWELSFGIRNPQTSMFSNGYGRSELEDLISTVTNLLNADAYNANYFKVGSNPKGILRVTGNVSNSRLQEFRTEWQTQMSGVNNAHKLPIIESEKMDFINTQGTNKEMEYSKYQEFLIKIGCAHYKMDPSEIGFPMSGASDAKPMFEGNNEARLKFSKDKGLKPLLKFKERRINKFIIDRFDDNYELKFVGLNETDATQELDSEIKKVQNFKTVNEVRREFGMNDIEGGDIILNPVMMQQKQMDNMNQQQGGGQDAYDEGNDFNPFDDKEETEKGNKSNPIADALNEYIEKSLS